MTLSPTPGCAPDSPVEETTYTDAEVAELIAELERTPDRDKLSIGCVCGKCVVPMSVDDLIGHIRERTPIGLEHLRLNRELMRHLAIPNDSPRRRLEDWFTTLPRRVDEFVSKVFNPRQ